MGGEKGGRLPVKNLLFLFFLGMRCYDARHDGGGGLGAVISRYPYVRALSGEVSVAGCWLLRI